MLTPTNQRSTHSGDFIVTNDPKSAALPHNPSLVNEAISAGRIILADSGSKAAACRAIFELIHDEHRDVILQAFMAGGQVTVKGAPTYFYNISKKFKRKQQSVSVSSA